MKIYAVVVSYNPDSFLIESQHNALVSQVNGIIYVDNGSSDLSFSQKLCGCHSFFLFNKENYGLARAQNQGICLAREKGADFIVFFDQDSLPPIGFVDNLFKSYCKASNTMRVALVGPVIRNMLSKEEEFLSGIIFQNLSLRYVAVKELTTVSFCISSGSLVPTPVLDDVGLMEEKLFIDGLDIEWCLRARHKGYQIIQTNATFLDHSLGDGTNRRVESHSPLREYYIMRNSIWMTRQKHIPFGYRLRKIFTSIGRLFLSFMSLNIAYAKADINGLKDGIIL